MISSSSRLTHPSMPMIAGPIGVQEFTITHGVRPSCTLMRSYYKEGQFLSYASSYTTTYKVIKEKNILKGGIRQVKFFAVHGPSRFIKKWKKDFSKLSPYERNANMYIGQVAWIQCLHGKLERIEVNQTLPIITFPSI